MTNQELEAVVGGYHGDPFSILGPHAETDDADGPWLVRVFLPQVAEVEVISDDGIVSARKVHALRIVRSQAAISSRSLSFAHRRRGRRYG